MIYFIYRIHTFDTDIDKLKNYGHNLNPLNIQEHLDEVKNKLKQEKNKQKLEEEEGEQ